MGQQRPTSITIIAILFFISGVLAILSGLGTLTMPVPWVAIVPVAGYQIVIGLLLILIGSMEFIAGWGLWTLQNWGRILAVILLTLGAISNLIVGLGLLVGVNIWGVQLSLPGPGIASLLLAGLQTWLIWYLFSPEIVEIFEGAVPVIHAPPVETPPPPPMPSVKSTMPIEAPSVQPTMPMGVPPAPEGWLVLRTGLRAGQQFVLKRGKNIIGRDPSRVDIVIDDETVSGEHAVIQFEGGQFYVYDLASTNGTYVNNRRIQKQLLMDGDKIRFGAAEVVFKKL